MSRRCPTCGTEYPDEIAFCGHDGVITIQVPGAGDTPDPRLGASYGEYVVVARVADGAMGRVYEGRHVESRQRVAIKVLHDEIAKDKVAVERFKREYETARDLASPHVVKVIDFGETPDNSWFMTMEYLEGKELGALVRSGEALAPGRAIRVFAQVALGLDDAHSFGVIHRDLKPDNLFLAAAEDGEDTVRILDFGSVKLQMEMGPKLTAFGTTLGSPYYMSPEQAMGKLDVDQRTDVFALAAILYEMLCAKIAFEGSTVAEILMKIVNEMPIPLSTQGQSAGGKPIPLVLDDVIERGLSKDKAQRPPTTIELAREAIAAFGLTVGAGRPGVEEWAIKSVAEIDVALAGATPPAPLPFGAAPPGAAPPGAAPPGTAPLQASPSVAQPATSMAPAPSMPAPSAGGGSAILLIVGAVSVLGILGALALGAAYYFFFM